ncbi:MAG: protein-L-isoaspartate O-methyltransferase [Alphaproteobacteria bacterium]|nr:protein-L-isoaspartate O-methyltransferase [Alphaproteobacteria bacterium]
MTDFAQARRNMVDSQLRPNGVTDGRILEAMGKVARETFVGPNQAQLAYMDADVPLKDAGQPNRVLIDPMSYGRLLQAADIHGEDRVLVIGVGTGYGAAVLTHIAAHVVAVENDPALVSHLRQNMLGVKNVTVVEGALASGAAEAGPFDVVIIEGRIGALPEALFSQVKNGGRLVCAEGDSETSKCFIYQISGSTHTKRSVFELNISRLPGFDERKAAFAF